MLTFCGAFRDRLQSAASFSLLVSVGLSYGVMTYGQTRPVSAAFETADREAIHRLYEQQAMVRQFAQVALSPDGSQVAWTVVDGVTGRSWLYTAPTAGTFKGLPTRVLAEGLSGNQEAPRWSPDGSHLAFLCDCEKPGQLQVFVVDMAVPTKRAKQVTHLTGFLSHPQWSPNGHDISFLYVGKATRAPTPMAAEDKAVGVIDDLGNRDIQRVAIVSLASGLIREVTPSDLYIFEYDWSPDGGALAYTAAAPPGDDNWYVAQLYTQPLSSLEPHAIHKSAFQLALPRWSPDGKYVAFIEGLMSDEGATGGEIHRISRNGQEAMNLTPGRHSTPAWFQWISTQEIVFSEFAGGSTAIDQLAVADLSTQELWKGDETIQADEDLASLSIASLSQGRQVALIRTSWSMLPEIWFGSPERLEQLTSANSRVTLPLPRFRNITWTRDKLPVQGWLLLPHDYDSTKTYPMLVSVHGGPAWISTPLWKSDDFNATLFTNLGYFVFFPNDRGSFGQGENFTQANRRDWGYGDLEDMLAGVDEVTRHYSVDSKRLGILGWSYGGSTAMIAAARTNRFRAAVAGAGASNLQSYYGQNSIDKWMFPYFGASVYDDTAAYMRCSAITYVKQAKTPTLLLVGERDGEAPPAQSFEFWHALKELNVPTQLVIYADEGHSFSKEEDRIDLTWRTLSWFETYMGAG